MISLEDGDETALMPREIIRLLNDMSRRLASKRDDNRRGSWKLLEEICAVPRNLWGSTVLYMASNRHLAGWKVTASGAGLAPSDSFPINNDGSVMPRQELDKFAEISLNERGSSAALCRTDLLPCLRALKILEQMVFSRSRISLGPLQTTLSIAVMLESSPSWTSVLHSLGLVLSYDTTEAYRRALIAEREQAPRGAFDEVPVDD